MSIGSLILENPFYIVLAALLKSLLSLQHTLLEPKGRLLALEQLVVQSSLGVKTHHNYIHYSGDESKKSKGLMKPWHCHWAQNLNYT